MSVKNFIKIHDSCKKYNVFFAKYFSYYKNDYNFLEYLITPLSSESFLSLYRGGMNFFACQALIIERECGTIAMEAFSQIIQKVKPLGVFFISCEETFHLLPAIIRLRKMEEQT